MESQGARRVAGMLLIGVTESSEPHVLFCWWPLSKGRSHGQARRTTDYELSNARKASALFGRCRGANRARSTPTRPGSCGAISARSRNNNVNRRRTMFREVEAVRRGPARKQVPQATTTKLHDHLIRGQLS